MPHNYGTDKFSRIVTQFRKNIGREEGKVGANFPKSSENDSKISQTVL